MPHLVWLYPGSLNKVLDAATWLETTNELRKTGWRVTLVTAGPIDQCYIRNTEVFSIPRPEKYLLSHIVYHLRFLNFVHGQQKSINFILFNQMSALWLLPVRLWRIFSNRQEPLLVMDIRSLHMPQHNKQDWRGWLREIFQGIINRTANHWIDGYLTITKRMAKAVKIPPSKLWGEWPSGVNLDLFASVKATRCWPLPEQSIHLVYIGALHTERNLMALCKAVEKANEEGMAFKLLLVGDGTARIDLEKFAKSLKGEISIQRPVPHEYVPDILASAHIGVLPFPNEEKFRVSSPIKLFEYMASGLPVLVTRVDCHTDVIEDGEFAFWAEDASILGLLQALKLIWKNHTLLEKMGKRAEQAAQHWTWEASAKKLEVALEYGLNKTK